MYNIWVFLLVSLWNFMHFALQLVCFAAVLLYMNKTLHLGFFSVVFLRHCGSDPFGRVVVGKCEGEEEESREE
jgi:hypothetical protein